MGENSELAHREPDTALMAEIVAGIDGTTNMEELLGGGVLLKAEEVVGRALLIHSYRINPGDFGPYAVIEAVDRDTRERLTVSCGGKIVLAQLRKAGEFQAFPFVAEIRESPTAAGRRVFRLVHPAEAVYEGQATEE